MAWFLLFVVVLLPFFLSFFTRFYGSKNKRFVSRVWKVTLLSFGLIVFIFIIDVFNLRFSGKYTELIVYIVFEITAIVYFLKVPTNWSKIALDFALIPTYLVVLFQIVIYSPPSVFPLDDTYSISTRIEGLLACGESISITKNRLWIFVETLHSNDPCLRNVESIDVIDFSPEKLIIYIHHDGDLDSENPYRYEVENEGYW
ncbi:hypothetical protein [Phaeocystidibacter luteus]|uniref:Uncharacterized protein n=1 Tax=Phaeocystidibacter luteus TaxID=911197 RepID=A0A6N6RFZ8_9FLAO|nr:hypothetical protein [Phaeocystidibacter luteus]KAB2807726.1 hypothetical protein F8C67_11845 [Phaeocystidibacter luteus]